MRQNIPRPSSQRNGQVDYVKGVLILLMVLFHLVYIGDIYPIAKRFVYQFHMPGFLFFSGYFYGTTQAYNRRKRMLGLLVPYLIMESAYILMASILPIRDSIDNLSFELFWDKLLLHPLGPFWYLQALIIFLLLKFLVALTFQYWSDEKRIIVEIILLVTFSSFPLIDNPLSFETALFLSLGQIVRMLTSNPTKLFFPSYLAVYFLGLVAFFFYIAPQWFEIPLLITYVALSSLLYFYRISGHHLRTVFSFIGRQTLPILLFSPLFTFTSRFYQPYMIAWDEWGILFAFVSVSFTVCGSLLIAKLLDMTTLSRLLLCGRKFFPTAE